MPKNRTFRPPGSVTLPSQRGAVLGFSRVKPFSISIQAQLESILQFAQQNEVIFERSEKIKDFERSEKSTLVIAPKEQLTVFLAALAQVKNAFFKFAEFGKISEFCQKFGFLRIPIYRNFQGRRSRQIGFEARRAENPG